MGRWDGPPPHLHRQSCPATLVVGGDNVEVSRAQLSRLLLGESPQAYSHLVVLIYAFFMPIAAML
jgi:hypothetical protein